MEHDEAVAESHAAIAAADRSDYIDLQGDVRCDLAVVLGGGPEATRALDEAVARYERKGNRVSAERARRLRRELSGTA
jgi:hypothetical protein